MEPTSTASFFQDKVVTLMGLGLLGRGVGDAAFLAQHCKKVYVTDMKSAQELAPSVDALKAYPNMEYFLGGHPDKIFQSVDFVIKGAGIRQDSPQLEIAKKNGIPIYMSTALFTYLSGLKTVGITGTRGKSSTTYMVVDILKRAGKKVLMGGNIRGMSTLAALPEAHSYDIAVLELDSWQLQGYETLKISPNVGVFTTFYPDHMNYYDGDMIQYLRDKMAIALHQREGDTFITTSEVLESIRAQHLDVPHVSDWKILPTSFPAMTLKLPGKHNQINAALAKEAARACGAQDNIIESALCDFSGIEGRLQYVATWEGRRFYNDSNATTQEATLAALTSFPADSIVLIFGGSDKKLPIDNMLKYISDNHIRAVLIKGSGSDKVLLQMPDLKVVDSMHDAVVYAKQLSHNGDNIILSPAFASFGVFKNEYDRSDQFLKEVKNLL